MFNHLTGFALPNAGPVDQHDYRLQIRVLWCRLTTTLLDFSYSQKIPVLLPGIYYLILSVYHPNRLVECQIPAIDKIRCLTCFPALFAQVTSSNELFKRSDSRNIQFLCFTSFTQDCQQEIWNSLPSLFRLGIWEDLKRGIVSTAVS